MQYYNRKSIVKLTDAAVEIVTLSEVKTALKIDDTTEDDLIRSYIKTARLAAEKYTSRAFISQTWKLTMDAFGTQRDSVPIGYHVAPKEFFYKQGDYIEVPIKPLRSITSLITYARNNTTSTYSASNYTIDTASGRLYLNEGQTFPTELRNRNAVELTFVAGYGDNPQDVPEDIRQAVILYATQLYETRGMCEMSCACMTLLNPYIILDDNWLC